jgi:thiol reductant ABC exporter CydD subunit
LGVLTAVVVIVQAFALAHLIAAAFLDGAALDELRPQLLVITVCVVVRALIAWGMERSTLGASAHVKAELRQQLLRAAVEGDSASGPATAEVTQLATRGLDALDAYFARYLPQLVLSVVLPLAVLATILPLDRIAFVTIALTLPLIPVFMALVGMATEASNRRRWDALTRLGHHFLDVVQGMTTLKVFGRGKAQVDTVGRVTDEYRVETMATLRIAFLSSLVLELLATLSVALVAVGIGLRLVEGELTLQTGLLILILAPEAYLPLRMVGTHYHASAEGLAAAEQALDRLDAPSTTPGTVRLDAVRRIDFDAVTVDQPGRRLHAPHDLTATAEAGAITALVGDSGSGKSTAVALLLGLRAPSMGQVCVVDGGGTHDVRELDPFWWRSRVAWVPQEPTLAAGSIADNVRWGDPEADDARITEVLARVGLDDRNLLPDGERTDVGERSGLSSGQRRRVGLARALVRAAPVLVLDEPSAGLDVATEELVARAIRDEAVRGAVVLVVAHSEAMVAIADHVVRVDAHPWSADARDDADQPVELAATERPAAALVDARVESMTP